MIDLQGLTEALHDRYEGDVAGFRLIDDYEAAAGRDGTLHPPTYPQDASTPYVFEKRYVEGQAEPTETVLLDSVASQANRAEEALQDAIDDGVIELPLLVLETTVHGRRIRITSLELPHRSSDAYLRDSISAEGDPFDKTPIGRGLRAAKLRDATAIYRWCPTALVYGTWDSHRGRPELSFKAPRIVESEVFGLAPKTGSQVGSRLDPLGMLGGRVKTGGEPGDWRLLAIEGETTHEEVQGAPKASGAEIERLSEQGHGNIAPSVAVGGVAVTSAHRRGSISLAGLRRLRFPIQGERSQDRDAAGRTVLAALALVGDRLAFGDPDVSLRSGCDLVVTSGGIQTVYRGGRSVPSELSRGDAVQLFRSAVLQAEEAGLVWESDPVVFHPKDNLQEALERNLLDVTGSVG